MFIAFFRPSPVPADAAPRNLEYRASLSTPVLEISQELLGEMIGVSRKTVNFPLFAFERDGLVRIGYGRITLCDLSGLRAIANG